MNKTNTSKEMSSNFEMTFSNLQNSKTEEEIHHNIKNK